MISSPGWKCRIGGTSGSMSTRTWIGTAGLSPYPRALGSAGQLFRLPARLAYREGGEDFVHPVKDGPHADQRHQRPLPGMDRPDAEHYLGDAQQQAGPPPRQLGAGQRSDDMDDTEHTPLRTLSPIASVGLTALVITTSLRLPPRDDPIAISTSSPRGCSYLVLTRGSMTGSAGRSGGRRLGELVSVNAGVDGVQHGQFRVVQRPGGVVQGVGRVVFGPVGIAGGGLGVQLPVPLVDSGFGVVHLGRDVGPHLRPFGAGAVGLPLGFLLSVLHSPVEVDLGLVDTLADLLTRFGGGSLYRRLGRRDALLQRVEAFGEVHCSSLGRAVCLSEPLRCRRMAASG